MCLFLVGSVHVCCAISEGEEKAAGGGDKTNERKPGREVIDMERCNGERMLGIKKY